MKKTTILLTTLALSLAACNDQATSGSTAGTTPAAGSTPAAGETSTDNASLDALQVTTESTPGEGSKTGKDTLVQMIGSDIPTLDPGTTYDTVSGTVVDNMYDTLVAYKGTSLTEFEPSLATEWNVSDDGLTYRFTMRDGVKFHTGNPFSCADAEYTLRRNLVTNTADSSNWFVAESLLGTSKNANDDATITWDRIANAIKCEDNVLVATLPKSDPAFLSKLLYTGQGIVDSKHAISIGEWDGTEATWKDHVGKELKGSPLAKNPSGTGAYQLVKSDSTGVTLKAFEDHWKGSPSLKNIILQIVPEVSTRQQAFLSGDADRVDFGNRESIQTQVAGKPGVTIIDNMPSVSTFAFSFNQNLEGSTNIGSGQWGDGVPVNMFADADARKCFNYAFDYPAYIEQVQMGKGQQLNVMLPKTFLGYDASIAPLPFDMAKAEEHCKTAHGGQMWENGFTLNVAFNQSSPTTQTAIEILKAAIEGMNPKFKVNAVGKQWADIINPANIEPMQVVGWAPDYADPDNFIHTYYHSNGYHHKRVGYNDPELDALIDEARSTIDEARRKELYSQITKHVQDKVYYLQMPSSLGISAFRNNLQGYSPDTINPIGGVKWFQLSKTD